MSGRTIVLLHGAWMGGWCWRHVAARLRAGGHEVHTPTQTGLGERRHLLSPSVGLETFAEDILNLFAYEDLRDVVLVGHSFGGVTATMVADRIPERIGRLVYLDGGVPQDGMSAHDRIPAAVLQKRLAAAIEVDGVRCFPAPPPHAILVPDPEARAWAAGLMTPHPIKTYEDRVRLSRPPGEGLRCSYIACVEPAYPVTVNTHRYVRERTDWPWLEVRTGHNAMLSAPGLVAEAIEAAVA